MSKWSNSRSDLAGVPVRAGSAVTKLLAGLAAIALAGAVAAQEGNSIERIDATQTGTSVILTIQLKNPVKAVPPSFSVSNPARVALDLPQTVNNLGRSLVELNQGDLRSVNVVQAQGRARVVLNLRRPLTHAVTVDGNTVQIALGAVAESTTFRPTDATTAAAGAATAAAPSGAARKLRRD